ncbi:sugar ABC transporter substrate-binding protein [Tsukamurella sp. 8F]|uniref:ABC transporter substrate-binding protein n=1 Tax=unclassified Tsukamurella TaxID=2633480 RepID=UPI0023BA1943|nr:MULTISPECIES: sugar ABC transporter substrate-binding protein [unclassified Tsukamurella]MDF0528687.1 sugar ABC transporter substrate-binding protein [Tsukamurella sp. 8J]MDF0585649.1 sugar ABC transporter substrate-binding protein [Tsukamurella sp. 8F]
MRPRLLHSRRRITGRLAAVAAAVGLGVSACAGAGSLTGGGSDSITIAIVSNSQMQDAISLSGEFEKANPGIKLHFVSLPENEARAKITASVATGGGEFDAVMVSNYETRMWAKNGWLTDLQPHIDATQGYDAADFIPSLRDALSENGHMYSVPFYGESSFLMYNKKMFADAGIAMDPNPTWDQVVSYAEKLDRPAAKKYGICLRGDPGWGEVLAPLDTVINAYGGRWFDQGWQARLDSPEVAKAVGMYVDLVRRYGEPGAASAGFQECANLMAQGQTAMWYDATSAVSVLEDPATSAVHGQVGYVPAPRAAKGDNGWLYTWSLGIPAKSTHKDAAWKFVSWMTSKEYIADVAQRLGPSHVPPGSRESTYKLPAYAAVAQAYAGPTLTAMQNANQLKPTVDPVPYTGIQFLAIPEFQDMGTLVSQQISAAVAGQKSVSDALAQAQRYADTVGKTYRNGA